MTLIVRAFWSLQEEQRINPHFETLFAVGVDEMSWDDMANEHFDWPPVSQVSIPFPFPLSLFPRFLLVLRRDRDRDQDD